MKKFRELNPEELNTVYENFIVYRDKYCNGWAKMTSQDFYLKFGFEPYSE